MEIEVMLSVHGLTKVYGDQSDARAGGVRGFSFELPAGTFLHAARSKRLR